MSNKRVVTFKWPYGGGHVLIAGDFSGWRGVPMKKDGGLLYSIDVSLPDGSYQYKFIVDGIWFYDTEAKKATDSQGNTNNIITVGYAPVRSDPKEFKVEVARPAPCLLGSLRDIVTAVVTGNDALAAFAKANSKLGLYGNDRGSTAQVNDWIAFAEKIEATTVEKFPEVVADLNVHLKLRTHFVGHSFTLADVYLWIALSKSSMWKDIASSNKSIRYKFLVRWWNYVNALNEFNGAKDLIPKGSQDSHLGGGTFEELKNAEMGKVVCRFPPEPSGYLHIGHAKAAFLNDYYARKYDGTLILRFDDTNPVKEKEEFEDAIMEDLETMGIKPHKTSHTSDFFGVIQEKAEEMIKIGLAFVDDSDAETISKMREDLVPSPARSNSVEKNLSMWEEMKKGTPYGQKCVLRAKIDYLSKNGTMRDPAIYRFVDCQHLRTKDQFRVYPLYHFACPIVDSLEGVTHALRSNEYHDSEEQYYWFLQNVPGLRPLTIKDFSRVNFTYTLLSKRKLQKFVDSNLVTGWDDPRFPTVRGITRRGLKMSALKEFIFDLGDSTKTVCMEILNLWAINKRHIDKVIPRYTSVRKSNAVVLHLEDKFDPQTVEVPRHRQNANLGTKTITRCRTIYIDQEDASALVDNEEFTLMDWGNVILTKIVKNPVNNQVEALHAKLNLDGDFKSTSHKLTWLPTLPEKLIDVVLLEYDTLITVKSIPKDANWEDYINHKTEFATYAYGDVNIDKLNKGEQFQLERVGYFVKDSAPGEHPIRLIQTPDGHVKNVFLAKNVTERTDKEGKMKQKKK